MAVNRMQIRLRNRALLLPRIINVDRIEKVKGELRAFKKNLRLIILAEKFVLLSISCRKASKHTSRINPPRRVNSGVVKISANRR